MASIGEEEECAIGTEVKEYMDSAERAQAEEFTNAITAVFTARSLSHVLHTKADGQEAQALTGDDFMNAVSGYMASIGEEEQYAIGTEVEE